MHGKVFSKIFFLGFNYSYLASLNKDSCPSNLTLSPNLASAGGLMISIFDLLGPLAHNTIPFDMKFATFFGFKFIATTTSPLISAMGMNFYNPDAISLISSPKSIFSQYKFSLSGWTQHFTIRPTLISS